jgi:hypothetical protein
MKRRHVSRLREFLSGYSASRREEAAALTVFEVKELENIFALLLLGSFVGFPAPPSFISVELMPYMEEELRILEIRAEEASDMFAEMVGTFGID